mgnify:CR=1 FL=1
MEINADNLRMVNGQIKPINGMTEKLVSIFNSLDREGFMPEEFKQSAYVEKNLVLSNHRVILKPGLVEFKSRLICRLTEISSCHMAISR